MNGWHLKGDGLDFLLIEIYWIVIILNILRSLVYTLLIFLSWFIFIIFIPFFIYILFTIPILVNIFTISYVYF